MTRKSDLEKEYYKTGEAAEFLGIDPKTVYAWTRTGKLQFEKSQTNRVQIPRSEIIRILEEEHRLEPEMLKRDAVYACVRSYKQKKTGRLDRQIIEILEDASGQGIYDPLIIQDVGRGLNSERPGMKRLMDEAEAGNIGRIFITHPDRMTRLGYDMLVRYFEALGVQIVCTGERDEKLLRREWLWDLDALMNTFAEQVGSLSAEDRKRLHEQIDLLPEEEAEETEEA